MRNDPSRRQHSFNFEIYRDIEECEVGEFKHLWETLSPVIKTVLLLTGGLCLLVHIAHVGRFPEDAWRRSITISRRTILKDNHALRTRS